jgi:hypothetical protein
VQIAAPFLIQIFTDRFLFLHMVGTLLIGWPAVCVKPACGDLEGATREEAHISSSRINHNFVCKSTRIFDKVCSTYIIMYDRSLRKFIRPSCVEECELKCG